MNINFKNSAFAKVLVTVFSIVLLTLDVDAWAAGNSKQEKASDFDYVKSQSDGRLETSISEDGIVQNILSFLSDQNERFTIASVRNVRQAPKLVRTTTGEIYELSFRFPGLGEVWCTKKLCWFELIKNADGSLRFMNFPEFQNYCAELSDKFGKKVKARSPSKDEFEVLRKDFGYLPETETGFVLQVFRNLPKDQSEVERWLWSATYDPKDSDAVFIFNENNGQIMPANQANGEVNFGRCVVDQL